LKGVVAQFVYVGAQVGVASFVIRYAQFVVPGTPAKTAALYLLLHQIGFMGGRFIGSAMMKKVAAPRLVVSFRSGFSGLRQCCPAGVRPDRGVGGGVDRILPLHYVSNHLCAQHQKSRRAH